MRLIDADALEKRMNYTVMGYIRDYPYNDATWDTAFRWLDSCEIIEAEPVKHGHWISDRLCTTNGGTYGVRRCSNCEYYCNDFGDEWNYCPHCGALMDEVEEK